MTHFAFVNKGQNQYDYKWNLTLIDKRKMCHFECHGLIYQQMALTCQVHSNLYENYQFEAEI
jgi:septin family protein